MDYTISRGDIAVRLPRTIPLESALTVIDGIEQSRQREARERWLAERKHLHDFGYNRQCQCGVAERDYHFNRRERMQCPLSSNTPSASSAADSAP